MVVVAGGHCIWSIPPFFPHPHSFIIIWSLTTLSIPSTPLAPTSVYPYSFRYICASHSLPFSFSSLPSINRLSSSSFLISALFLHLGFVIPQFVFSSLRFHSFSRPFPISPFLISSFVHFPHPFLAFSQISIIYFHFHLIHIHPLLSFDDRI